LKEEKDRRIYLQENQALRDEILINQYQIEKESLKEDIEE